MIIGVIGLILVAISWIPQLFKIFKAKKSGLDWRFAFVYVLGSLGLVIYSIQIKDIVFLILNSSTFFMGFLGLILTLKYKNKK
jgi:lipid-A-disaccharide synthase-like uncharacterized protein